MPHPTHPSTSSSGGSANTNVLPEKLIQDSFHSYLRSSLTQAKAERLLDEDLLSSAEADLMITGPALCLFFAALRSTTNPPSVPLPRAKHAGASNPSSGEKNSTLSLPTIPTELSYENCPPAFVSFLRVWAKNVPRIQSLAPEYQHDVARVICGLPPLSQPVDPSINGIAADLRGVAIEISQRRSFQERYGSALQAALDSNVGGKSPNAASGSSGGGANLQPKRASFVPPPVYEPSPPPSPGMPSGNSLSPASPNFPEVRPLRPHRREDYHTHRAQSSAGGSQGSIPSNGAAPIRYSHSANSSISSTASLHPPVPHLPNPFDSHPPPAPITSGPGPIPFHPIGAGSSQGPPRSPSLLNPQTSPAIEFIRETLYASIADQLERHPSLQKQLKADPMRAYFGSVSFAVLDVAMNSVTPPTPTNPHGTVRGVIGKELTLRECPEALRPFFVELVNIGKEAKVIETEDTNLVVKMLAEGEERIPKPRLERVKKMLEFGIGIERDGVRRDSGDSVTIPGRVASEQEKPSRTASERERRDSLQGRAVAFTNRISALALGLTSLRAFKGEAGLCFQGVTEYRVVFISDSRIEEGGSPWTEVTVIYRVCPSMYDLHDLNDL
ncbi:hypothetical protein FA13DRAFT_1812620 [Coprinellus micaceus]|uniref:Uncharacterized protein n=1 Tax=Coprinellus micaceus TaxID=71717 RepID=A0A4Y7TIP0_COPMI|nr:hypothetical protein FA13DRAFT_1812620 [Coprinellus micaceus]